MRRATYRQPCAAHALNLAIGDIFNNPHSEFYIEQDIQYLVKHAPYGTYTKGYKPVLQTIRWISLYTCVHFIYTHANEYLNARNQQVRIIYCKIDDIVKWEYLDKVLEIFRELLSQIETDIDIND